MPPFSEGTPHDQNIFRKLRGECIQVTPMFGKRIDQYRDIPFAGGIHDLSQGQAARHIAVVEGIEDQTILYMSPRGGIMDEGLIRELSEKKEFTILCGHYEGVDQRIIDKWNMKEVSIGDYVLTGGELPAMVLIDAVSRFVPGVLGNEESAEDESIYSGLLEADQYTRPRDYEGLTVPEILTGGDHHRIRLWQLKESVRITAERRPEMLRTWLESKADLSGFTKAERKELTELAESLLG